MSVDEMCGEGHLDCPRITDLSALDPENFKVRNTEFLKADQHPYDNPHDKSFSQQRNEIWRVRNGDLKRVLEDFPRERPLLEQCALWMHAVVGKHFFEDANHRTAMALLRKLLAENGIDIGDWPTDRVKQARDESHRIRKEISPIHLDTLYEEDELYEVWLQFFKDVLPNEYC